MNAGRRSLTIVILLTLAAPFLAARHLPIQVFTSAQGLPRNTVECLMSSQAGLLWTCTQEGLARFDGYHFRVFGTESGLPSRHVIDMAPARGGGFWVLTEQGLCRLFPNSKIGEKCRLVQPVAGDIRSATFGTGSILESETGSTFITNGISVYRVTADGRQLEATNARMAKNQTLISMADGRDGSLLLGSEFALYEWKPGGELRSLTSGMGAIGVMCFYRWSPTEYWIGATTGFYRLLRTASADTFVRIGVPGVPDAGFVRVTAIVRRRDGSMWVSGNGISRVEMGANGVLVTRERYTMADGLPSLGIAALVEDERGNLWGATEGSGIFRIENSGFVSYSSKDGLGNGRIAAILEDTAGNVLVQTSWDGQPDLHVKNGDQFRRIPIQHPPAFHYFGWGWNQYIVAAHDGSWWVPTGEGLLRFPKLAQLDDLSRIMPETLGLSSPLACKEVFRAYEDPAGDMWLSCVTPANSLIRWHRQTGTFQTYGEADGLPPDLAPLAMRTSPHGDLWLASPREAIRFRNGKFEVFPLTPGRRQPYVRDMLLDSAGRVWMATQNSGLFRCDNSDAAVPTFRAYTVEDGLATNYVSSVVEDAAGYIYAGTARGVDRIDPNAPIGMRRIRHFTAADGLPESEQNTALRDSRGHLWFGALDGLAELDPSKLARHPAPDIYLTRVRVRGEDVPLPWEGTRALNLQLSADRNQVEIEYSAIDLSSPDSLLYQYRLQGSDRDWSPPGEQQAVNFATLPAGDFRFEVRAMDADGQVSRQVAGFDLSIASPLWRRWWFLSAMATLLTGALILLYDYRVRHLLAMERLRTRIATDLHDDIGASLTQISILSELARRGSAPQVLSDIANIARGLVSDMSDIVWAVNPRHDRFDGLVHRMRRFANDVLGGADINLKFETEGLPDNVPVPLEARRPLYLVLKEAVNNVARHSGAHNASIRLEIREGSLRLEVTDDGRGFDATAPYQGEGIVSITRRLREMGGSASWEPIPAGGTRFTAVFPLPGRTVLHELIGLPARIRR